MTDIDESLDIRPEEKKTYQEERAEIKEEILQAVQRQQPAQEVINA